MKAERSAFPLQSIAARFTMPSLMEPDDIAPGKAVFHRANPRLLHPRGQTLHSCSMLLSPEQGEGGGDPDLIVTNFSEPATSPTFRARPTRMLVGSHRVRMGGEER